MPGLTGAHLLVTDTPKTSAPTTEQRIRGADATAAWIILIAGYDVEIVPKIATSSMTMLDGGGLEHDVIQGLYNLAYTMTPSDR